MIIGTNRQPILGAISEIGVVDALPNGLGVMIAGLTRTQTVIGNVILWTQSIVQAPIRFASAGTTSFQLRIPVFLILCGV